MKINTYGFKSPAVAIVGCVHGNEKIGAEVIQQLESTLKIDSTVKYVVANEEAMQLNQRFISSDLNRSFPGDRYGTHEEQLAFALSNELYGVDYTFDLHSTTAQTDDFIITVGNNDLAQHYPLKKVVDMSGFASGVSLIENVMLGIAIEYNRSTSADQIERQVRQCLVNLGLLEGSPGQAQQEKYRVYGILEESPMNKDLTLENFVETSFDGEIFIPILYGELAYENILCLKARRIE